MSTVLACIRKGFMEYFNDVDADIFSAGDKAARGQIDLDLKGYYQYWNYAKERIFGDSCFTKHEPISVEHGIGIEEHDQRR